MDADSLDERLEALREAGWILTSRQTYTLSRVDRDSSVRSFHSDNLDAELVRRVEAASVPKSEPKPRAVDQLPPGWVALAPVQVRDNETRWGAEKLFPGDGKPVLQSSATEAGLLKACRFYDAHKTGDVEPDIDPEMARRTSASRVSTGLSNTHNTRY